MKLVINNLGKILIVAVVVALFFVLVSSVFIPGIRNFVSDVFPDETNYIDSAEGPTSLTLTCTNEDVQATAGEAIDIFSNITALSGDNENLISQLKDDCEKAVSEREHVFIYKTNEDNTNVLQPQIDSNLRGKWTVFYILKDGSESASLKVTYTFN